MHGGCGHGAPRSPLLTASAALHLALDPRTGLTGLSLAASSIEHGVDPEDLAIAGANACGRLWCSLANLAGASGFVSAHANEAMAAVVKQAIEMRTCRPCGLGCDAGTTCDGTICRTPGGACVPAALAWGGTLASDDGTGRAGLAVALADDVDTRHGGIDLALRLGVRTEARHLCAPEVPSPPPVPLPRAALDGASENGVDVRIAIGEPALARVLWAVHQAGLGCGELEANAVPGLGEAALSMLLPSSRRLAPLGLGAPRFAIRPLRPYEAHVRDDGGVTLRAPAVQVDIEAEVGGRLLRIASAVVSLEARAQLGIDAGAVVVRMPHDGVSVHVDRVWSAPVLGASTHELEATFGALSEIARAALPERLAVPDAALPLPHGLVLAGPPHGVEVHGVRALVIDLRATGAQ